MSVALQRTYTPQDLLAMEDSKIYELEDGHLVEREMSMLSSWVGAALVGFVGPYVREHQLGWAWGADLGYTCFPDSPRKVRYPDVSFIRSVRLPGGLSVDEGYCDIPPDLAVEVVSPNERSYKVQKRVVEYLEAGVLLVWVIDPEIRRAHVYRRDGSVVWLREKDELSGEDVIPGFRCRLASILPEKPVEQPAPDAP
jgi:Uma2 family endonuclease